MKILKVIGFSLFLFICSCASLPGGYCIICAGDSITQEAYPDHLKKLLSESGIQAEVFNFGISGHTSGEYLNFLKSKAKELIQLRPDFILLQLGTNDVRIDEDETSAEAFYSNMKEIVGIFKCFKNSRGRPSIIFLATIPPIPTGKFDRFSDKSRKRVTEEINPLIERLIREEGLPLVDNYSLFINSPELLPEIHPSQDGYRALARNWQEALMSYIDSK